jgi:hypothetical protein
MKDDYWPWLAEQIRRADEGDYGENDVLAWLLATCGQIIVQMQQRNVSYHIGDALQTYLEAGLLLADVHTNNVGIVNRRTPANVDRWYWVGRYWVITDPGRAVVLKPELLAVKVDSLEGEAR